MRYDAVIIGAGVAGLTAGLALSRRGKKFLLLERQASPGGMASGFKRRGFQFESALHCVDALGQGGEVREFLAETGLDKKIELIELKNFSRIIYPQHDFVADANPNHYISFLKNNFPHQALNIDRLFAAIAKFYSQFDKFYNSGLPLGLRYAVTPLLYPSLLKISGLTAKQLLETYISDKKLIAILSDIWRFIGLPASRVSAFYFLLVFRGYYYSPTAYVRGGFAQLFKAMVAQIRDSGSEVRFNTPAQKIISSKDKMVNAVITDKGEEIQTRVVISNANAVSTLAEMLDGAALKEQYARRLGSLEKSISAFQVYLGLGVPAKSLGMSEYMFSINTTYDHDADFACAASGDYERCSLELVDHAQVDPGLVPDGKGSLLIMCLDSYANWKGLSADEYRIKKEGAAQKLIARAEHYLPGLSRHIEVMEAATPLTVERFGSSPQGAIYGFAQTPSQTMIRRLSQETSVKGLFLAGAWTRPGAGVHACVISGIDAANLAAAYLRQP